MESASYLAIVLNRLDQQAQARQGVPARETLGNDLEVAVLYGRDRVYLQLMRTAAPGPSLLELTTCLRYWPEHVIPQETEKMESGGKYYLRCWWDRRAEERDERAAEQAQLL